jgi:hypothetical protein
MGTAGVDSLQAIAYGDGMYMAVGYYGEICISTDGKVWNLVDGPGSGSTPYYDAIYVEGVGFVIAGYGGEVFLYNRDGTWSDMSISGGGDVVSVTHGDGMYVAVGYYVIYTRGDGDTYWTQRYTGAAYPLRDVAYADGKFTAVGPGGTILTSDDGANWTQPDLDGSNYYEAVGGGGGIIVAVANDGQITTCDANGVWTTQTLEGASFSDVIYVEGVGFAAVGTGTDYKGVIYISQDGINWIPQSVPDGVGYLCGITYDYDNGKFVAVDTNGNVLEGTPE